MVGVALGYAGVGTVSGAAAVAAPAGGRGGVRREVARVRARPAAALGGGALKACAGRRGSVGGGGVGGAAAGAWAGVGVGAGERRVGRRHSWGGQRLVCLAQAWAEPEWVETKVTGNIEAAGGIRLVSVATPEGFGYTAAGQYVQIKAPGVEKPGFFAVASAPASSAEETQFLVKCKGEAAEALCGMEAGAAVTVSKAMGGGFNLESALPNRAKARSGTVLLFATGTGIAPIRALIENPNEGGVNQRGLLTKKRKAVRLYYGARTPDEMAFASSFVDWHYYRDVEIVPCISQPPSNNDWKQGVFEKAFEGYVQDALRADKAIIEPKDSAAFLCGQKEMVEAVKALLLEQGVPAERMLLNF